jgi:single-stranded-DNA-specific exonuclease
VNTFEEARDFFRPDLDHLHDPFLMCDMEKAVDRIFTAHQNHERVLVYGDYDVDGTTSVAMMASYLRSFHSAVDAYIPDRYKEGYGISFAGIDYAFENGCTLIVALDCGIKAIDKVNYAAERGIDFIICDHHRPGETWPKAVAVLDPKRPDCDYPYKELSGCGVGFKLIQALHQERNRSFNELEQYLDLLAVSIGSDLVPITGENRILCHFGLVRLNSEPRPAFRAMMAAANKRYMNITDVVFTIGPRINAAGRIEHGQLAVNLLTATEDVDIEELNQTINEHNATRKSLDQAITEEALAQIVENKEEERSSTVVYREDWHKGVIGIVASRLTENYYRPTVVFTKSNGVLAGSARSVKGFDVYNALNACADELEQFGGHMYAAGMTLKPENFEAFKAKFEEVVASTITKEQLTPVIWFDEELQLQDITDKFYRIMKQMAPFGPGNMSPVFLSRKLKDAGRTRTVGREGLHLKLHLTNDNRDCAFDGIAFGFGHLAEDISNGMTVDIVYHIEENEWQGNVSKQLRVLDIKPSSI